MKTPVAWYVSLLNPTYIGIYKLFSSKNDALEFIENNEMFYRRVKLSEPLPLYTDKVPDGYMLVKEQSFFERLKALQNLRRLIRI